jgi:hypothetical protein
MDIFFTITLSIASLALLLVIRAALSREPFRQFDEPAFDDDQGFLNLCSLLASPV